jgi:PilZ domain
MDKRRSNRTRHRLTCEIVVGRQAFPAVVRDIGPTGLFIQTRQRPAPNSVIELRFPPTAGLAGFQVEAGVARHRNVHPRLQLEVQSGVGLEILGRPPEFLALASRVAETKPDQAATVADRRQADSSAAATSPAAQSGPARLVEGELRRYRVRLAAHGRNAPKTLTIQATSLAAARARAISQLGAGWKITDVETF